MSTRQIHLVETLREISEFSKPAGAAAVGRIILVPVDFSDHSAIALEFAATIAASVHAGLVVLHVIHDPAETPGYYSSLIESTQFERIEDIAKQAFAEFMSRWVDSHPDSSAIRTAEAIMVIGLPATRILEVADEISPFMVVMGSHGHTGLDNLIIGSKAAQLIQLCRFPVTIVKKPEKKIDD